MTDEKKPKKEPKTDEKETNNPPSIDIHVNELGEVVKNFDLDELNDFLDENVDDKKLKE